MNSAIDSLASTTFAGKRFNRKQLVEIQQTVRECRHLSHRELGHTVCEHMNWITPGGNHRIQTCLNALKEMESAGLFQLPEKQTRPKKAEQKSLQWTEQSASQPAIEGSVGQFTDIRIEPVTEQQAVMRFNEYIDRYHYLGYRRPIGNHLRYFIIGQDARGERLLGCLLFAFAVNRLECRDLWIGWNGKQRDKHLPLVINNTRFLMFPWVRVKNLASKALSLAANRVADDWLGQHGLHPLLMETFVDTGRFSGACYKAANWLHIGHSSGRENKTPKAVFVYPLREDYRAILTQNRIWLKPKPTMRRAKNTAAEVPNCPNTTPSLARGSA